MANNIELLSNSEFFTIGTNSNLSEILANVVKIGTDTSNVTISIPQDISSSYNLILPVRQGASGESLVYGADGQLKWHDTTVLKQVISVYGSALTGNVVSTGTHDSPTYLENYIASISPKSSNSKIFVQFKVNYHAALSASNQISFYIKKTHDGNETIFTESLFGPYNGAGGFTGQYISNLVDEALTSNSISYQLGYQINGNVAFDDVVGILGYDSSYNNSILLQEFEGSGSNATSVWNKGSDSNGLYYNDGTVHIGSNKNAIDSINTPGVALELSGNLVGTNANFSGNINANNVTASYFIGDGSQLTGSPSFTELSLGITGTNGSIINLNDYTNFGTYTIGQIKGIKSGINGGQLEFHTSIDTGLMIERLRINSEGAIGINGANYGTSGQVLTSDGSGSSVSWTTPTTPTPDFVLFGISNAQTLTAEVWNDVLIEYAFTNSPSADNHNNVFIDNTTGIITFSNPGVYLLNATFWGYWGLAISVNIELLDIVSNQRILYNNRDEIANLNISRDSLIFSGGPIKITSVNQTFKFRITYGASQSNASLNSFNTYAVAPATYGSIIRLI